MVHKLFLITVIEIRRRLTGSKGRHIWPSLQHTLRGIAHLLDLWKAQTLCLDFTTEKTNKLYSDADFSPTWWLLLTRAPTVGECDNTVQYLRGRMHGRQRTDLRRDINSKVAFREKMRQEGKLKVVLKSILGPTGGRKYVTTLNLEVIKDRTGRIACSPAAVHRMVTEHFIKWYAAPRSLQPDLHTTYDWRSLMTNPTAFNTAVDHTGVPP